MDKKKIKLSISGNAKKTINNIEQAKSNSKNTVVIEKKGSRFTSNKQYFSKTEKNNYKNKTRTNFVPKKGFFKNTPSTPQSDYEKRKLAEQRATKRLKGEINSKDGKGKTAVKRRELKLTISRALSGEENQTRARSLASLRRAKQKENREKKK